jgi:aminopeptidase N
MSRVGLLDDRAARREHGLPPELRPAKLEDLSALARNQIGGSWATADITVSTQADQTPIAPGKKASDIVEGGRRTARFVSDTPILPSSRSNPRATPRSTASTAMWISRSTITPTITGTSTACSTL